MPEKPSLGSPLPHAAPCGHHPGVGVRNTSQILRCRPRPALLDKGNWPVMPQAQPGRRPPDLEDSQHWAGPTWKTHLSHFPDSAPCLRPLCSLPGLKGASSVWKTRPTIQLHHAFPGNQARPSDVGSTVHAGRKPRQELLAPLLATSFPALSPVPGWASPSHCATCPYVLRPGPQLGAEQGSTADCC